MRFENKSLVDKLSEVNKKLEKIAYFDPLTCLANRRWFQTRAEEALSRCVRYKTRLALLLIDVDNFKQVNDQQGHAAGDNLLISIADRLTSSLRQTDTVIRGGIEAARYGGDEFVVLLEDISDKESVELVVKRIFSKLNVPIDLFGKPWPVTVSIGIAIAPDDANNFTTLTRSADTAMYRAKENGRNQYCFFNIHEQTVVLQKD
ncbi:MAG: GGDEF domain-containing protein [Candidatus Thiodiazotropha sp.]|nr:GGDEF domain-containing protein [Candidatus Thiodiazotropha sp.]MCM8921238.1 GGDEF domain-containing protein [Candidatus Thiodiazotropha sp.]